jgi:hypothetical protein
MMAEQVPETLGEDLIGILTMIRDKGGTDCTGT